MAATRATAQGFASHGGAQNGLASRLGHGHVETLAATWRTFVQVTLYRDGHGFVTVKRDGGALHEIVIQYEPQRP